MKPVFRCDYCDFIGTEKDVKEHEPKCTENYTRRSCLTCKHKSYKGLNFTCVCGMEIPDGKMREFCPKYERKEKADNGSFNDLVEMMFGR